MIKTVQFTMESGTKTKSAAEERFSLQMGLSTTASGRATRCMGTEFTFQCRETGTKATSATALRVGTALCSTTMGISTTDSGEMIPCGARGSLFSKTETTMMEISPMAFLKALALCFS